MFFYQQNGVVSTPPLLIFLIFEVFLWFLLTDVYNHLLGLLITLELFLWAIVPSSYNIIVFLPAQQSRFTSTIVDCYILIFLWFLPMDNCNNSLWSMIPLEIFLWAIILSMYWYYDYLFHLKYSAKQSKFTIILL